MESTDVIARAFAPLYGAPCWLVREGHGSFLTLEIGGSRAIDRGEWHLWIYCCAWRVTLDGRRVAHSESDSAVIQAACALLDSIQYLDVHRKSGGSSFSFSSGANLDTRPYGKDDDDTQWILFCPNGNIVSYKADGSTVLNRE